MSLTSAFDAPERAATVIGLPVASTTNIFTGNLVAIDSSGNGLPATDTAGLRVAGRAEEDIINGLNRQNEALVRTKRGCFLYNNSTVHALGAADVGTICFVEECDTVAKQTTHSIKAGVVIEVNSGGVYIDTRPVIGG